MNNTANLSADHNFSWRNFQFSKHPLQSIGMIFVLAVRFFLAIFYIYGTWHKLEQEWLWTDILKTHFTQRLSEIDAASFSGIYLQYFAIPMWLPIAYVVTLGELYVAVALTIGWTTRAGAAFSLFLLVNFAFGAYYNIWIYILSACSILIMLTPTGRWLGIDRKLERLNPNSLWFR